MLNNQSLSYELRTGCCGFSGNQLDLGFSDEKLGNSIKIEPKHVASASFFYSSC